MIFRNKLNFIFYILVLAQLLAACAPSEPVVIPTPTLAPATATFIATETQTPSTTPTATLTPTPSETPTPSITPTYAILRGKVVVQGRLTCRFGPGADYLYKFTFGTDARMEILGRMEYSDWILVQAAGGSNRCWVNGAPEFVQIDGDRNALEPVDPHIVIAWSPYYGALSGVSASRDVNNPTTVTVSWNRIQLRAGDDSEQTPYIVEAWVCRDGEPVFEALGTYRNALEMVDEGGCAIQPHARVAAAEKHGYTPFAVVPWPAAQP